jgi:hypothetical protein
MDEGSIGDPAVKSQTKEIVRTINTVKRATNKDGQTPNTENTEKYYNTYYWLIGYQLLNQAWYGVIAGREISNVITYHMQGAPIA